MAMFNRCWFTRGYLFDLFWDVLDDFSLSSQLYLQWHLPLPWLISKGTPVFGAGWPFSRMPAQSSPSGSSSLIHMFFHHFSHHFPHVFHDKSLLIGGKSMVNPPTDRRRTNSKNFGASARRRLKMRWLLWLCPSPSRRCSTGRKPGTHQKKMMLKTSNYYRCTDTGSFIIQ